MSLRRQISVLLIVTTLAFLACTYAVQALVVLPTFAQFERNSAVHDVERCVEAIHCDIESISHVANEWSASDDIYQFVQDQNQSFVNSHLLAESFRGNRLNLICILDNDRHIIWGEVRDTETLQTVAAPDVLAALQTDESPITTHHDANSKDGILLTSQGPLLLVSRAITNTARIARIRGRIVMGRFLSPAELESLATRMHLKLKLVTLNPQTPIADMQAVASACIKTGRPVIEIQDANLLRAYSVMRDVHGQPALLLCVDIPREVTAKGAISTYISLGCTCVGGLLTLVSVWIVLQWRIVSPLRRMAAHSRQLGNTADLNARLHFKRNDEIGTLAQAFDEMVERLALSQQKTIEHACSAAAAQHAAEAANVSKSEFLANMSHEIRTPMTAILGFADMLLAEGDMAKEPERRIEAARTIQRNGDHLLGILNDILDLSKVEAGKLELESLAYSPQAIVEETLSLMRVRADGKKIALQVVYETPIPATIQTDPRRLRQILVNLVGNAIKFTEAGCVKLIVRFVAGNEPKLEFDVLDTGAGMTADQRERIFQPFIQADNSSSRKFGGTGLGLTISRRLAELLNGDVTLVESTPGIGTRFRLAIATGPLKDVRLVDAGIAEQLSEATQPHSPQPTGIAPLTGCSILLAEDGPDNQRLISFMLKKAGAEVTVVENGQLAVDAALRAASDGRPFHIILTDIQMPVLDGYEAVALLRAKGYRGTIIALTAHAMSSDREKCLRVGCNDYATKPIHRTKLIAQVAGHFAALRSETVLAATAT